MTKGKSDFERFFMKAIIANPLTFKYNKFLCSITCHKPDKYLYVIQSCLLM